MQPLFTVATITYNSSKWVRQAVESILSSTYTDFELLISDDASTDNTWEIIQEYNDDRITAIRNDKNVGEYNNRNGVLNIAKGKYIIYIDGDDILYKDTLRKYADYISFFPDCPAIWGVDSICLDFIVFPCLLQPEELTKLNFLSLYQFADFGFQESLFKVETLKELGGLSNEYISGDTYLKKKFCCHYPVVLIPTGNSFWRQHPNQASKMTRINYQGFIETYKMDREILYSGYIPLNDKDREMAISNFKIRTVKLLFLKTIFKLKPISFFKLIIKLRIPFSWFYYLFREVNTEYNANASSEDPMLNSYNFHYK